MSSLFEQIWEQKWSFFAIFFIVISFSYLVLLALDFYPEPIEQTADPLTGNTDVASGDDTDPVAVTADNTDVVVVAEDATATADMVVEPLEDTQGTVTVPQTAALPNRLVIPRLGRDVQILNPTSRTVADLDAALLSGVVRHPDSATLAQEGNVFILGHSSYLPNVFNKNFQAFNGIQDLEWGDTLVLYTKTHKFEYRVDRVYRARAQDVTVPIANTGSMLTLATCNSFGSVDDRYIVEAKQQRVTVL